MTAKEFGARLSENISEVIKGKEREIGIVTSALLAGGHVLLEDVPGTGKTMLARSAAKSLDCEFRRIQFTPDLLPSDILGTSVYDQRNATFTFRPGPIFTNVLLADEINRASPKTQSAMLEAMQEHAVTLLGETRPLPDPFFVLASQNPIELEGTYPIPEAQLDRFLFKINVSGVDADVLTQIIAHRRRGEPPEPEWTLSAEELKQIFAAMDRIYLSEAVANYIARIVAAGHPENSAAIPDVTRFVTYGPSPRAAIALAESSRAAALLAGRPAVGFEDVRSVAPAVLNHRLILNYQAKLDKITPAALSERLLEKVDPAGIDWPQGISSEKA